MIDQSIVTGTDPGVVVTMSHLVEIAKWLGGAVLAIGALLGLWIRWMMAQQTKAVDALTTAVETLRMAVSKWDTHEEKITGSCDRIERRLEELDTSVGALDCTRRQTGGRKL